MWAHPFFADIRGWQRDYGYREANEACPDCGNWLAPCIIRDHHSTFLELVRRHEPAPLDDDARAALADPEYHAGPGCPIPCITTDCCDGQPGSNRVILRAVNGLTSLLLAGGRVPGPRGASPTGSTSLPTRNHRPLRPNPVAQYRLRVY